MIPDSPVSSRAWPWSRLGVLTLPIAGLLWQSFFWLDGVPAATKAAYAGLTVLSAIRPASGLLVVAALATLGGPIGDLVGASHVRVSEALMLTFLVGWLTRCVVRRESILDRSDSLSAPIALFALTVAASLVVTSAALQTSTAPPLAYVQMAGRLLALGYLGGGYYETHNWYAAALLVEGVLLVAAVLHLTRRRPDLQTAAARMLALGVVAAAMLSVVRLGIGFSRTADPFGLLIRALTAIRISAHVADLNAAGSHFVLALPLLWALGMVAGRWRPAWVLSIIPVVAALWLTGSRSAQFSILLVLGAVLSITAGRIALARLILVAAALIAIVGAVIFARPGPESSVVATLQNRWLFSQLSWHMFTSAPLFGVGISEYYVRSEALMPDGLRALYAAENAHNNFAQIGVELGVTGLGLFLWVLASAWRRARRGLLAGSDPLLRGLVLGLAATLLTFLMGHPLLIGAFACSFWIALGLAVARADTLASPSESPAQWSPTDADRQAPGRWKPRMLAAIALVIAVSVPFRAHLVRDDVNLSNVRFGFAPGGVDSISKDSFRWAGPRATIFVSTRAQSLYLSVSPPEGDDSLDLEMNIDGRLTNRIALRDGLWQDMRFILPVTGSTHLFRRIDFVVRRSTDGGRPGPTEPDPNGLRVRVRRLNAE